MNRYKVIKANPTEGRWYSFIDGGKETSEKKLKNITANEIAWELSYEGGE